MATRTEPLRVLRAALVLLLLAAAVWGIAIWTRDEDRPVDAGTSSAQRAIAVALDVVPGRFVEATFDIDDDKWEIIVAQDGTEYEVELDPVDLSLLRIDYD